MDRQLLFLCLSCAVISQAMGYGYYEPRVVVPAAPVAAHRHRFAGSLLLSKAKAFIKSDDATFSKGYGYAAAPAYGRGYAAPAYGQGYAAPAYGYGYAAPGYRYAYPSPAAGLAVKHGYGPGYASAVDAYPNRYYNALQTYKARPAAPLFVSPYAPVPVNGGYLKYNFLNELARKDDDYRQFKAAEADKERYNYIKYRKSIEEKNDKFEDYLKHEAEEEEDRQRIKEFRKYSKINEYVEKREKKAEFNSLIGQVDEKRREYVFNMVYNVMQFCKCRDAIVDLHRYFSGQEQGNRRFGAGNGGQQTNYDNNVNNVDDTQLFGEGGVIPIPRSPEEAKRWFMRGLVNTICDSSKFYVEKVKTLAAQQGFSATFEAQFDNMANGQFQGQNQGQGGNYGNQDNTNNNYQQQQQSNNY
ncbi:hypothetical protein SNE40_023498 [Patella caerulea]|uniref:Uncharacterized protein n=1 Tax=Patella caerulea TaxID=87958 RepID=A0AAN8IX24_PATCE